jgi:hypothetical protein
MTRAEVSRLRALLAREGTLPAEVVAAVLVDLEAVLGERDQARELIEELVGPWRRARDGVLALAVQLEVAGPEASAADAGRGATGGRRPVGR